MTVAITLCVPPRQGELCAPIRFLLRHDTTVLELTARHRITGVTWDPQEQAIVLNIDITDPETARPVDVRFDVIVSGGDTGSTRSRLVGRIERDGQLVEVHGTYLGVVADEN
jgi:hypothetical protein